MTPSANDLFMNVWVSRISSETSYCPGDKEWDRKMMNDYWSNIWIECKELSQHLQRLDSMSEIAKAAVGNEED